MIQNQLREKWVDDVKLFACILVTLGHFFQSMVHSSILPETFWHSWFDRTIYYFHVPLFFLCSGYLYQKKPVKMRWVPFAVQKGIALGIPYLFFSIVSWLLKELFSSSVNRANAGFFYTLFLNPTSPYWYLYTLFFIFLICPFFSQNNTVFLGVLCSVLMKAVRIFGLVDTDIYAIDSVMDNLIWFALGMVLYSIPDKYISEITTRKNMSRISGCVFLIVSLWISAVDYHSPIIEPIMGFWGCVTVVMIMRSQKMGNNKSFMTSLTAYTMPIFLMHTIFAAGFRAVLLKLGVTVPIIHVISGITVSFLCPIVAAFVMKKLKLDCLIYPGKYFYQKNHKEAKNG